MEHGGPPTATFRLSGGYIVHKSIYDNFEGGSKNVIN